jgi:hypothetical protein
MLPECLPYLNNALAAIFQPIQIGVARDGQQL